MFSLCGGEFFQAVKTALALDTSRLPEQQMFS
jgi:hypothetical protein